MTRSQIRAALAGAEIGPVTGMTDQVAGVGVTEAVTGEPVQATQVG